MKFISICSGIEAASVAFGPLGWKAIAFSEIEPFPCAVLAHHYPDVPNFGDMTKFRDWPEDIFIEADAIVGGPPCQAFSVAGKRNGLNDDRGNLTLIYSELIDHADAIRIAHGKQPVIVLYENVPGLLSDKTNAFGCFLGALAGEDEALVAPRGKWTNAGCVSGPQRTLAWTVTDAQFFGVAQRRRRVFVVASARDGFNPAEVLFEPNRMRRDTPPSREAGQSTTHDFTPGLTASGRGVERIGETRGQDPVVAVTCMAHGQGGAEIANERSPTLTCNHEAPIVAFSCKDYGADAGPVSPTLRAMGHGESHANAGGQVAVAFDTTQVTSKANRSNPKPGDPCHPLAAGAHPPVIAFNPNQEGMGLSSEFSPPIGASTGGGNQNCIAFDVKGGLSPHGIAKVSNTAFPLKATDHKDPQVVCVTGEITHTLRAEGFDASEDGTGRGTPVVTHCRDIAQTITSNYGKQVDNSDTALGPNVVAVSLRGRDGGATAELGGDVSNCLRASSGGGDKPHVLAPVAWSEELTPSIDVAGTIQYGGQGGRHDGVMQMDMQVRRLTPEECEKLQGFPPGYTMIPWRKKPAEDCPDGPRYKALGNSWAVPNVRWIGERIDNALRGNT